MESFALAKFPPPRAFQDAAHNALRAGVVDGHRVQCVMSPTGSGKTYLGMRIIHEALMRNKRAMFVCDRTTLINQTSAVADAYGLSAHSVMQASHWRFRPDYKFQIASAQTLARRGWPDADVIVVDECHTLYKSWTDHVANCDAAVIGLSATPFSPGMGNIFTNLVNAATMDQLTRDGILVPMRVLSAKRIDMRGAKTIGGEWSDAAAAERGMEIIGDVVTEWSRHAENRKTIVFGATIAHCEAIARQFNDAGFMAATFTADTTPDERKQLLAEFAKPDSLRVLVSVEALAKGFDVPDVGCVCDCRPLRKSLSTAIQMWGRGLRSSPETGKTDCLLLDFSGNIVRFADDFSDIFYNGLDALDSGEKLDKVVRKDKDDEEETGKPCPSCGYKPVGKRCIACGWEYVRPNEVEHHAGELMEFAVGKAKIGDKLRVWEEAVTYCDGVGNPDTAPGRAAHLYKSITGVFPRGMPAYQETRRVPVSRAIINKARANMIAYRNAT